MSGFGMSGALRILSILTVLCLTALSVAAQERVALVVGVERYEFLRPLENPINDASAIEEVLDELGFEVFFESNRNLKRMRRALDDFREDAAGAELALVFFAGHGMEVDGVNMLMPKDARAGTLDELRQSALPLEEIVETVQSVARHGIIIVDACRTAPFGGEDEGRSAMALDADEPVSEGMARMGRADNLLFSFSAAPGQAALDGQGDNSPFVEALRRHLSTPGLEVRSVLTLVQQDVYDRTRAKQLPYVESGLPQVVFVSGTSDLPEREALLMAMAGLTEQDRVLVEKTADENDVPLAPLFGALIEADLQNLTGEKRQLALEAALKAYLEFQRTVQGLAGSDPQVQKLREEASEQMDLGAVQSARALLDKAAEIDREARTNLLDNYLERTVSEAKTHMLGANLAGVALDREAEVEEYLQAIALFREVYSGGRYGPVETDYLTAVSRLIGTYQQLGRVQDGLDALPMLAEAADLLSRAPDATENDRIMLDYESSILTGLIYHTHAEIASSIEPIQSAVTLAEGNPGLLSDGTLSASLYVLALDALISAFDYTDRMDEALEVVALARNFLDRVDDPDWKGAKVPAGARSRLRAEMGVFLATSGRHQEAELEAAKALELAQNEAAKSEDACNAVLDYAWFAMQTIASKSKNYDAALRYGLRVHDGAQACLEADPENVVSAHQLAVSEYDLAEVYLSLLDYRSSAAHFQAALETAVTSGVGAYPFNESIIEYSIEYLDEIAGQTEDLSWDERVEFANAALEGRDFEILAQPANPNKPRRYWTAKSRLGESMILWAFLEGELDPQGKRTEKALLTHRQAMLGFADLFREQPESAAVTIAYALASNRYAEAFRNIGDHAEEGEWLTHAETILAIYDLRHPGDHDVARRHALQLDRLGSYQARQGHPDKAAQYFAQCADGLLERGSALPLSPELLRVASECRFQQATFLDEQGTEGAAQAYLGFIELTEARGADSLAGGDLLKQFSQAFWQVYPAFAQNGDNDRAEALARRALSMLSLWQGAPQELDWAKWETAAVSASLGEMLRDAGQPEEALALFDQELSLRKQRYELEPSNATAAWDVVVAHYHRATVVPDAMADLDAAIQIATALKEQGLLLQQGLEGLEFLISEKTRLSP